MSLNNCEFIGRAGAAPEVKETKSGKIMVSINLAVDDSYKDDKGEKVEKTSWFKIVFFDGLADVAKKYVTKGKQVFIQAKARPYKYEDDSGVERYGMDFTASKLVLLGKKSDTEIVKEAA